MGMGTGVAKSRRKKKRTGRRAQPFSPAEQRRLLQLGCSLIIFVVALLGRSTFPDRLDRWNEILRQDADFRGALSRFGEAATEGEPFLDAFGELCIQVFAGDEVPEEKGTGTPPVGNAPDLAHRFVARMRGEDLPPEGERVGA